MKKEFNIKKILKQIDKEYSKQGVYLEPDSANKKPFLMREQIYKEGMTFIEKIEYWLAKKGLGGMKLFCKWHRTFIEEAIDKIDLDVKDIKIVIVKDGTKRSKI